MSGPAKTIAGAGPRNKLPKARCRGPGHRRRLPATFDLPKPCNVFRNSLFAKDSAGHRHEHARSIQTDFHRSASAAAIVVDVLLDHRMHLEGESERFVSH